MQQSKIYLVNLVTAVFLYRKDNESWHRFEGG